MSENMAPWLILAAIAVAALVLKGYIRLPSTAALSTKPASGSNTTSPAVSPSVGDVGDVEALGLLYARAVRRQAEDEVANAVARKAGKDIKEAFTAPFSVAAPSADASQ